MNSMTIRTPAALCRSLTALRAAGRAAFTVVIMALLPLATAAHAGDVLLTVNATAVGGRTISFDLAALDALPQLSFKTSTPWTKGVMTFSGPALKTILDRAGATKGIALAIALNDYSVKIPVADADAAAPVVVTRIDGKTYGVRAKGPLWVLYPFDSSPKYRTEVNDARSIWQLTKLTVTPG